MNGFRHGKNDSQNEKMTLLNVYGRHRERALHTTENDTVTHCNADVTQSNAPDKIRSEEIRSERQNYYLLTKIVVAKNCPHLPKRKRAKRLSRNSSEPSARPSAGTTAPSPKRSRGQVAQAIKALKKAATLPPTCGNSGMVDNVDWRGLKGQAPTINQLRSDIGKIRQPVPAHQPSSNGRNGTGYQTGIDWDARIGR